MARVLSFCQFSVAHVREQIGAASKSVLTEIAAAFDEKIANAPSNDIAQDIRLRSLAAQAILTGKDPPPSEEEVESSSLFGLAHDLVRLAPKSAPCPDFEHFFYALSQCFCFPNPDVDGMPLTIGSQQRRVGRYLHSGRPFFGSGFADGGRHGLYGWLSGEDELQALSQIVQGDAWQEYTSSRRYKSKGRPAFHEQRNDFDAWILSCLAAGDDIFFSSLALFSATDG
jgi:hypothetical protein